jgi:hypothetical protein
MRIILGLVAATLLSAGVLTEASAYPVNEILRRDHDACKRQAVLRRGYWNNPTGRGFGFDKMYHKHNLKRTEVFSYVLRNPNCGTPVGGHTRKYNAYAHLFRCSILSCEIVARKQVFLLVDYRNDPSIPGQKGAITAYCENQTRCDNWVDRSINLMRGGGEGERTAWSYKPMSQERTYKPDALPSVL